MEKENKYISGPANIIRLEGKINNINKIIYLFCDIHLKPIDQTECENVNEISIKHFFKEEFNKSAKKSDNRLDFFCECTKMTTNVVDITSDNHMMSLYKYIFKLNKKNIYKNIFIHQIDMRSYMAGVIGDDNVIETIINIIKNNIKNTYVYDVDKIINGINHLRIIISCFIKNIKKNIDESLNNIDNIIKKPYNIFSINTYEELYKISPDQIVQYIQYFFYKLICKINNKNLKIYIINTFKNTILINYNKVLLMCDEIIRIVNTYDEKNNIFTDNTIPKDLYNDSDYSIVKNLTDILLRLYKMHTILLFNCSMVMDIYFIKRFLDKDYIKKVVSYVGAFHGIDICQILVQNFDFKITNVANLLKGNTIKSINTLIKNSTYSDIDRIILTNIFKQKDGKIMQCSNLLGFPNNFN